MIVIGGAGLSLAASGGSSAASWLGLLEDGISRCEQVYLGLPAGWAEEQRARLRSSDVSELLAVSEEIARVLDAPTGGEYRRWLRESVGELRADAPAVIEALRDLDVPILTTNYDSLIEDVTGLEPVTWKDGARVERLLRGDEPGVFHLHGHWRKPETVVLGIRSYEDALGDESAQFVQRAAAAFHSLLFIGCGDGLDDPNFSALREWLGRVFAHAEHRHFRLALDGDAAALSAQHHRPGDRIVVVPYGTSHDELVPFLRRLRPARVSTEAARPWWRRTFARWKRLRLRWRIAILLVLAGAIAAPLQNRSSEFDLAIGATVTGTIEYDGSDLYRFSADDGQRINLINEGNAEGTCEGLDDLTWSLQQEETGQFLFRNEPMTDCTNPAPFDGYRLAAGTYRLTIHNEAARPRSYAFTLVDADPNVSETRIGATSTGTVEKGVVNVHTFTVDQERRVYFDNQTLDGTCDGVAHLAWTLQHDDSSFLVFDSEPMSRLQRPLGAGGLHAGKGSYSLLVYALRPAGAIQVHARAGRCRRLRASALSRRSRSRPGCCSRPTRPRGCPGRG